MLGELELGSEAQERGQGEIEQMLKYTLYQALIQGYVNEQINNNSCPPGIYIFPPEGDGQLRKIAYK